MIPLQTQQASSRSVLSLRQRPVHTIVLLMAAASASGARVLSGISVDGVTQYGDQVTGITASIGAIPADQVIVATGVGT